MGTYSEFYFKARLRKDTPKQVIDFLDKTINHKDIGLPEDTVFYHSSDVPKVNIEHEFFECPRWEMLFLSNNWSPELIKGSTFKDYILEIHSEFKNYDGEIDKFIDWISPFIAGHKKKKYLGYEKGEWTNQRTNIYKEL